MFNFYHNSLKDANQAVYYARIGKDTLFDFAKVSYNELPRWATNEIDRQEMRELFAFVREKKPELFEDFYEFNVNRLEG